MPEQTPTTRGRQGAARRASGVETETLDVIPDAAPHVDHRQISLDRTRWKRVDQGVLANDLLCRSRALRVDRLIVFRL